MLDRPRRAWAQWSYHRASSSEDVCVTGGLAVRQVRKTKVYDEIVDQIKGLITEGRIKPGDRLPPERELAELFKASRNSVRDAIRVLEQMGLIESRQGDGTYVRTLSADELTEPPALCLLQSRTQMRALWDLRRRDPAGARAEMLQHLREIEERVFTTEGEEEA